MKDLVLFASIKDILSPLVIIRKRKGDNRNPWHNPLLGMKKEEASPLTKIENYIKKIKLIIQLINGTQNPKWIKINLNYNQQILSYAFDRSILTTIALRFLDFMEWRPSLATPLASCIFLPSKNINYSPKIDLNNNLVNLLVITIYIIL